MTFLHKLLKSRRSSVAGVASASFWALVFVFSVFLAARPRDPGVFDAVTATATPSSKVGRDRCQDVQSLPDNGARCAYLRSHPPCTPEGYADYLRLFYCLFGRDPWLGGAAFALWLLVLFYLLGDTASQYFCASLEGLSAALRLPPAVAGVTFLALGNGAPDVLSSVVAFASGVGGGAADVGLSSALGGALFVSTVVTGVVALVAKSRDDDAVVERRAFVRDVCFLLVALLYLLALLLAGAVTVWAAASFLSLYAAYVLVVWISHFCATAAVPESSDAKLASAADLTAPLLPADDAPPPLPVVSGTKRRRTFPRRLLDVLHAPLYLPRRLTIPDIAAHRWSKPYAVASAFLAPLLLAAIYSPSTPSVLLAGALVGSLLAAASAIATDASSPPQTTWTRLPWLGGGFLMSVLWSYMLARELVALLVAIGLAAGVSPSLLGATVLAWGNSLGDLVANVAIALRGGPGGVQTAVSGCYAGPAFNTVVGLGLSLTLVAGARYPDPYAVPVEASAYQAVGFLVAALLWALVVLLLRGMRMGRALGAGLLLIYLCFLTVRICDSTGVWRIRRAAT
ncbi:hypothetical protein PR202_gb27783 [Eleusine coracana subsp. coracana]|uniref:Sodium/calcium exchanger membrane region domain-containing protein n=1 Tax=Eleusine coracana subsp. coracana TaxID=191504 RepID=A0AAV5FVY0_ELECO|nr:hypothetical protein QOZ80_6AG0543780 [Eleusine coracana subsp. coracana]GJN38715.1 hypothetical protein PR202_gb27783 [Eleusine coracana subsp. coracana]